MPSKQEKKHLAGVEPFLDPGEQALAALTAQAKGVSAARGTAAGLAGVAGVAASEVLGKKPGKEHVSASDVGLDISAPMAIVLTDRRLITLRTGTPIGMGLGGAIKSLLSAVPISDVESIELSKFGLAKRVELTVRGVTINLECNSGASTDEFAEAFNTLSKQ
ncbi:MAG: hypothetical protein ABW033_03305 [Acidimicrobiia bacterium]